VWGRTGGGSHGAHGKPPLGAAQGLVRVWRREEGARGQRPGGAREEAGSRVDWREAGIERRGRRPGGAREEAGSRVDWREAGAW